MLLVGCSMLQHLPLTFQAYSGDDIYHPVSRAGTRWVGEVSKEMTTLPTPFFPKLIKFVQRVIVGALMCSVTEMLKNLALI